MAFIKSPLLGAFTGEESSLREDLQMLGDRRLADAQLARDQQTAYPVFDQISVTLRRKNVVGGALAI
jgi:hypothetical protein